MRLELVEEEILTNIQGGGKWTNTFIGAMDGAALGLSTCGPWCGLVGAGLGGIIGYNAP